MTKLNRFPLLGLWARAAAERMGYSVDEAKIIGHAYAVLYAIRARGPKISSRKYRKSKKVKTVEYAIGGNDNIDKLKFCGDFLEMEFDEEFNIVKGLVGGGKPPQTPETYEKSIERKFPEDFHLRLYKKFSEFFESVSKMELDSKLVYDLYDRWKKECGVGRFVDLEKLEEWIDEENRRFRTISNEADHSYKTA